jgi:type IV secretion system protein VirB4
VEAVLRDYAPTVWACTRLTTAGLLRALEFFGYVLNRIDEPVPVLSARCQDYLPVSRHLFSAKSGDFAVNTPNGIKPFGAILNIKEYPDCTYPGISTALKYLDFEYVITHSFSPMGRQDALKVLDRTKGMMISSGDKAVSQIVELDQPWTSSPPATSCSANTTSPSPSTRRTRPPSRSTSPPPARNCPTAGFVSVKEDLAVTAAFYAQFPGNWKYVPASRTSAR